MALEMAAPKDRALIISKGPDLAERRAVDDLSGFLTRGENHCSKQENSIKFYRFDFGALVAVKGSLGMIWPRNYARVPVGWGSNWLKLSGIADHDFYRPKNRDPGLNSSNCLWMV